MVLRNTFEPAAGEDMVMLHASEPSPEGFKALDVDDSTMSKVCVRIGSDAEKLKMTVPDYLKAKGRCPA